MIRSAMKPLLFSAVFALAGASGAAQTAPKGAGHWEGTVQYGNPPLSFVIDLSKNATGAWVGTFSIPGSATTDVPLTNITMSDAAVSFSLNVGDVATFEGKFSADGGAVTGSASNSQGSAGFDMKRTADAHVNAPAASSALPKKFEGAWEGAVDAGGQKLRIGMKLSTGADGKAAATLTSIDQGAQEFPASTVTVDGKKISIEIRAVSGMYTGTLGDNGEVVGEFSQGGMKLALVLRRPAKP